MKDILHAGGLPLLFAAFLGIAGILGAAISFGVSLIFRRGWILPLLGALLLGMLAAGTAGAGIAVYGARNARAEEAAARMPEYRAMIEREGGFEASVPLVALLTAAAPAALAAAGLLVLATRRKAMPIPIPD